MFTQPLWTRTKIYRHSLKKLLGGGADGPRGGPVSLAPLDFARIDEYFRIVIKNAFYGGQYLSLS
jgi:hypothetical protein